MLNRKPMLKNQIDILIKLQSVQSEAAEIKADLNRVFEKINTIDMQRQDFEKTLSDTSSLIEELTGEYRTFETDAKMNQSQVEKSQEKLRSVKTNKEYQASLKEIEELKARNSQLEDEMLECLDQIDAAEKVLAERKIEFQQFSRELDDKKNEIEKEAAEGEAKLDRLITEERDVAEVADTELLEIFKSVKKKQTMGRAIVPVTDAVCHGCNVNLPPQMYNELQKCDKLQFCPNCQRIIYWSQA